MKAMKCLKSMADYGSNARDTLGGIPLRKRIRLVNILSLACAAVSFFSIPFDRLTAPAWMLVEDGISFFVYLAIPFFNRAGHHAIARLLFLLTGNVIILSNTLLLGTASGIHLCSFGLAAFAFTIFDLQERVYMWISAIVPLVGYFFFVITDLTWGESRLGPTTAHSYYIYSSIVTVFLIGMNIYFLQRTNMQAEAEIQSSRDQAIRSEKMAALGEMSSGLAHEINTPLMALQLNASLLKNLLKAETTDQHKIEQITEKIDRTIARITKVTHSLQAYSRSGERDPLTGASLQTIVSETLDLCRERFKNANIDLQVEPIDEKNRLRCRSVQISQILLNLLNNAYQAVISHESKWVRIETARDGDFTVISISDSGPPIASHIRAKIFEPFFTTKPQGQGSGLGLNLSRQIAEEHGGSLELDRHSSETRFVLRIPRSDSVSF